MKKVIRHTSPFLFGTLLLAFFLPFNIQAYSQTRWEKLGHRRVNFKNDKDEIGVGKYEGFFNALQLKVKNGTITVQKMVVHFHNGETREIELRSHFTDGSESRVIDLPGKGRIIEKVVFWYETTTTTRDNKAVVELWGRH